MPIKESVSLSFSITKLWGGGGVLFIGCVHCLHPHDFLHNMLVMQTADSIDEMRVDTESGKA